MKNYKIKVKCLNELTESNIESIKSILHEFLYKNQIYYESVKIIKINKTIL